MNVQNPGLTILESVLQYADAGRATAIDPVAHIDKVLSRKAIDMVDGLL
jgi:hypothetical protein